MENTYPVQFLWYMVSFGIRWYFVRVCAVASWICDVGRRARARFQGRDVCQGGGARASVAVVRACGGAGKIDRSMFVETRLLCFDVNFYFVSILIVSL